jgi:hypothetical protein
MSYNKDFLLKDLETAKYSVKKQDFTNLNIYCNRIMSNAYLLDNKDVAICGLLLKDLSYLMGPLKQLTNAKPITSAIQTYESLLEKIQKLDYSGEFQTELWSQYHKHLLTLRKYLMDEYESSVFPSESVEIAEKCFSKLIDFIDMNKEVLKSWDCRIFDTIMVEMTRIYTTYGMGLTETKIRTMFFMFELLFDYAKRNVKDISDYLSNIDKLIIPYLDRWIIIARSSDVGKDFDKLLVEMIVSWRELYLLYSEPLKVQPEVEYDRNKGQVPIVFPQETKDKLASLVTKSIEDQIKEVK